jgi:hypothetical protein
MIVRVGRPTLPSVVKLLSPSVADPSIHCDAAGFFANLVGSVFL